MAKYFWMKCANPDCPSDKETTCHKLVGGTRKEWVGQCEKCQQINERDAPERTMGNMRYPYYNASVDKIFGDRNEEKAFVKKNNLVAIGEPK